MGQIDLTVEICGMSGDGTIAAGGLLNAAMARAGLSIMAFDSYPAEIRGFGRCVTRCRIGDADMLSLSDKTHVLISLDDKQSMSRLPGLAKNATVFFDNRPPAMVGEGDSLAAHVEPGVNLFGIPFGELAAQAASTTRGKNIAALGAFAAMFGIAPHYFQEVITDKFSAKGETILNNNLASFDAGYEHALEKFGDMVTDTFKSSGDSEDADQQLVSGNLAIAEGAMDAGLKLFFGYPITPATPIMEYLAKVLPQKGGRVMQMEDEISSVGAVLGSFFAGTRAMTATSGPGFALMTEFITHGVMTETPAVIVNTQRGGPSTGLPTKTEQSDLHAAVFGGPGDSARIVLAPTDVAECYHYIVKSFQLAEKYQTPVIVLTDFYLNNRVETVRPVKATDAEIADGNIYPEPESKGDYNRFEVTESGISPKPHPGTEGYIFTATGLEHSPQGNPNYVPENHQAMNAKRYRKILNALDDMVPPEEFSDGGKMDVGVVAWGSTFGAALEAVQNAQDEGLKVGALKITSIFPYHDELIREFMGRCDEVLVPELNFQGQLANLIDYLYAKDVIRMTRTTGVPIYPVEIYKKLKEIIAG